MIEKWVSRLLVDIRAVVSGDQFAGIISEE